MARNRWCLSIVFLFCQFELAAGQTEPIAAPTPQPRIIPRETLSDLAVAFADPNDPVIYYNPRLMERFGPEIAAFVLAHEHAHIRLGHRRPVGGDEAPEAIDRLLQGWELEADCVAASSLARDRPSALHAAIAFFRRMGPGRVDQEHPTGHARAARLEACALTQNGDLRSGEGPRSTTTATATSFK